MSWRRASQWWRRPATPGHPTPFSRPPPSLRYFTIKGATSLLTRHNVVQYDKDYPPQRALSKLIEVTASQAIGAAGAAAAAATPGRQLKWMVMCDCKTFTLNLLCSHVVAYCHVRGHINLATFEAALPVRRPPGRPPNAAPSFMAKPPEAAAGVPSKKTDPLGHFTKELENRPGLAFIKWNAARKGKDGFIEVGKITGFKPDGPYWRVTYEPVGSEPVEFEDLDKKEMAMALALNVTHGGAPTN